MASKKSNPADVYRPKMESAATAAETTSPFTKRVEADTEQLYDLYTGKTPFDLSKMPNASPLVALYKGAKERGDRGRVGKGLAYGGGPGQEGYNANLIASMDQQSQDERERDAAGMLEQRVADTFAGITGKMAGLGDDEQGRRNKNFDRYAQMYQGEINKPQKPKWWETLIGGAAQVGAGWASGGFKT